MISVQIETRIKIEQNVMIPFHSLHNILNLTIFSHNL